MNFLEIVIAINFSKTSHVVEERKVPTIAMNNPPVTVYKGIVQWKWNHYLSTYLLTPPETWFGFKGFGRLPKVKKNLDSLLEVLKLEKKLTIHQNPALNEVHETVWNSALMDLHHFHFKLCSFSENWMTNYASFGGSNHGHWAYAPYKLNK